MISSKIGLRIPISLLAALSVAITFTLSSFAAPSAAPRSYDATIVRVQAQAAQTGVLTATGPVTVNGNQAATGMTILTGNVIQVGGGGHAIIDLGALGRTELGPGTAVTLQMLGNVQESSLTQCGSVIVTVPTGITGRVTVPQPRTASVRVSQGKVTVKYDNNNLQKVLGAGENAAFDNLTEVVSDGGAALFEVCCGCTPPPAAARFLPFSPWWFLLAIPAGVGIGLGVTHGEEPPPVLSPVVPG